jgi:serine/threonine-protein kinase
MDGGRTELGEPYFVMEYVAGEPLTEWIARKPAMAERLRLFRRVGEAVEYAHRNLVVHRDLKPSNILVTAEGQPKLLDFGIARLLDESAETGPSPLTPRYAAPEQLTGGAVTTWTDVYGLGLLLCEVLGTGRPDGELGQIAAKALQARPEDRYRSVGEMLDDVRAYETGLPVRAHGAGWMYRTVKFGRRHWIGVGFVAALMAAVALLAMQSWRLEQERERARLVAHIVPELFAGREVRAAVEKNLPVLRVRYAGQPLLWAELLEAGGHTCLAAGERGRAAALYAEALEIRRRLLGEGHPDVVETRRHLEETRP